MRLGVVTVALAALLAAGAADARRLPTPAEDFAIDRALRAYSHPDILAFGPRWRLLNRCSRQMIAVSTVARGWAVTWFRVRPNVRCRFPGTQEGWFVARRDGPRRWTITGWISGEYTGFCGSLRMTGIPVSAFDDAVGHGFWSDC